MTFKAIIREGRISAIYDDSILPYLTSLGVIQEQVTCRRASYVEPLPQGGWCVDFAPIRGPRFEVDLAGQPFRTHQAALDFERTWLEERMHARDTPMVFL